MGKKQYFPNKFFHFNKNKNHFSKQNGNKKLIKNIHKKLKNQKFKNLKSQKPKIKFTKKGKDYIFNEIEVKYLNKINETTTKDFYNRFHNQIIEYEGKIILKGEKIQKREKTIRLLKEIIKSKYPNWKVKLFGSFSQKTSTIYSDLDFVIFKKEKDYITDLEQLILIKKLLYNKRFGYNILLIKARVPIIKVVCQKTGISSDISVNRNNGCEAAEIIKNKLNQFPILRTIIILLKVILKKNNLNDAHIGGMSSFLLFSIVFFYFQKTMKENKNIIYIENKLFLNEWENDLSESEDENNNKLNTNNNFDNNINENHNLSPTHYSSNSSTSFSNDNLSDNSFKMNYGKFLYGFLKFYGMEFDYLRFGISLRNGGELFYKVERDNMDCSELICVENFQDNNIDIGHSCHNYEEIIILFRTLLQKIEFAKTRDKINILECMGLN